MALASGVRLGPYEIVRLIGVGGMGEVYRARDTRLDRTVAIKVLSEECAGDPDRRARFEREALAVAALNHSHICALHDVGEAPSPESPSTGAASIRFLVMEHLEGQTLAERLMRGPLPASETLRYAIELADALDHAHRHGLVHRDLKPGNVMMTKTGAKLLDFGLSKLRSSPDLLALSTVSPGAVPLTAAGAVLGTYPYMAPEQLAGHEADGRSDIFAFGAMVYEMATGRRAFEGTTAATVIGAVLHTDPPPVSSLQPLAPHTLDRIVARCLAKDPDDRWQTARDLMLELKWIAEHPATLVAEAQGHQNRKLGWIGVAALLVSIVALAAAGIMYMRPLPVGDSSVRLTFSPPAGVTLTDLGTAGPVTISPDGRRLAFVGSASDGKRLLWVRELDSADAKALPGTDGASYPFWSPDSRLIGFFAHGNLKKITAAGGPPQTICSATQARGGTWNENGDIVFSGNVGQRLYRTSADGGPAVPLLVNQTNHESYWPSFLPDGSHFVYFARPEKPGIYLASLDSNDTTLLAAAYVGVAHVPGYLLLLQSGSPGASQTGTLIAQPFDAHRLQLTGEGSPIAEQVEYRTLWARGGFSVSNDGTLIVERDTLSTEVAWFDRRGQRLETVRGTVTSTVRRWPDLSPDDTTVAMSELDAVVQTPDIHLFDLVRGIDSRLTSDPALDAVARWSPDGTQVVFTSARDERPPNLFRKPVTGRGREERLLESRMIQHPTDWSRDGRYVLFAMLDPKTQWDLWLLPMNPDSATGSRTPAPLLSTPFNEHNGQLSPDGRWMAYESDESGEWEIYLREFAAPADGVRRQISTNGGVWPVWRRDGRELFYIAPDGTLTTIAIKPEGNLEAGVPRALFKTHVADQWQRLRNYAVARDGQRFLINTRVEESSSPPITVTLNWPAALRR